MAIRHAWVGESAVFDRRLSDAQFRTLCGLLVFADQDGFCHPSRRTLSRKLNRARPTISDRIGALLRLGYVTKKARRRPDGGNAANEYWVARERPEQPSAFAVDPLARPAEQRSLLLIDGNPTAQTPGRPSRPSLVDKLSTTLSGVEPITPGRLGADHKEQTKRTANRRRRARGLMLEGVLAGMGRWAK